MMYESPILNQLARFNLEDIDKGIDELEKNIGKIYIGKSFNEKLAVLYVLRKQAKYESLCREVSELKDKLFNEWMQKADLREARVKTFNTCVKYQNQSKGLEFVRDGLKREIEQLQTTV